MIEAGILYAEVGRPLCPATVMLKDGVLPHNSYLTLQMPK